MSEPKVLHKCEDCGCEILDRGDGTAEVSSPNLFTDCESCQRASHDRMRELGQRAVEKINHEFLMLLAEL